MFVVNTSVNGGKSVSYRASQARLFLPRNSVFYAIIIFIKDSICIHKSRLANPDVFLLPGAYPAILFPDPPGPGRVVLTMPMPGNQPLHVRTVAQRTDSWRIRSWESSC